MWSQGHVIMTKKAKKQITLRGESVEIVEHLCQLTGLTPRHVVELMLRRYGRELESWVGGSTPTRTNLSTVETVSPSPTPVSEVSPVTPNSQNKLAMPTDPGRGLKPIQL